MIFYRFFLPLFYLPYPELYNCCWFPSYQLNDNPIINFLFLTSLPITVLTFSRLVILLFWVVWNWGKSRLLICCAEQLCVCWGLRHADHRHSERCFSLFPFGNRRSVTIVLFWGQLTFISLFLSVEFGSYYCCDLMFVLSSDSIAAERRRAVLNLLKFHYFCAGFENYLQLRTFLVSLAFLELIMVDPLHRLLFQRLFWLFLLIFIWFTLDEDLCILHHCSHSTAFFELDKMYA